MTLKLGYLLPTRQRVMEGEHHTDRILELADLAEEIGLDSVWIGDSVIAKPRHDPIVLLAAIAARTERIALGTAVLVPMLRNPVLLAHQLATLDRIAYGRFVLGIGLARDVPAIRAEFEAVGVPFEKRVGRMLEGLRLCRALWSRGSVDWDGRWKLEGATLAPEPFTPGGPKIWGGGGVPAALRRCARNFDGWFPSGRGGGAEWGADWRSLCAYAEEASRDPAEIAGAAYVTVAIDDDPKAAEAALDSYLVRYYNLPAERIRAEEYVFAGDRAAVAGWIAGFVEAGCDHLCVRVTGSDDARQMEELAELRDRIG
ncbi:MAG: LLM class flavin-dependent oxidoreductase [Defluviicoccus sp.]|nr:LLM class flavin-dependent oxidoreductase [Defluviicoccus sp.]MDE0277617.1 LLM class flavin-dependent oxidoreductase [Defluviicoccus sp.]